MPGKTTKARATKRATKQRRGRRPGTGEPGYGAKGGPLTPRGYTGHRAHDDAVKTAELAERRQRAFRLFVDQRWTMAQIGKEVGVTAATVCRDIWAVVDELRADTRASAERWREIEIVRTEQADRQILPALYGQASVIKTAPDGKEVEVHVTDPVKATELRLKAHARLISSSARRAALTGADMPVKVAPTTPDGDRPYRDQSDEDLDALILGLAREAGLNIPPGSVIDVTPEKK